VAPDTLITLQGSFDKTFVILHSGAMEVLSNDNNIEGLSPENIISGSTRAGIVKAEFLLGFMGILQKDEAYSFTLRTLTECTLSTRPMTYQIMMGKIKSDYSFYTRLVTSLVTHVVSGISRFKKYRNLWHSLTLAADSLALGLDIKTPLKEPGNLFRSDSSLNEYSGYLKFRVKNELAQDLEAWDYNIFHGHIQNKLGLYSHQEENRIESHIDFNQFVFFKHVLEKDGGEIASVISKDEMLNQYVFEFLGETITSILNANKEFSKEISNLIDILFTKDGWVSQVESLYKPGDSKVNNFLHVFAGISLEIRKEINALSDRDILKEYEVFSKLGAFKKFAGQKVQNTTVQDDEEPVVIPEKYKNLLSQLMDYAESSSEFQEEFTSLIDGFISNPEPQVHGPRISEMYWQLYESCYMKIAGKDLKEFIPGIMLHMGVIDERLLTGKELTVIDKCYSSVLSFNDTVPVLTLPYFLEKIHNGEAEPSMNEMGDVFSYVLRVQKKLTEKERENIYLYKDDNDDRVRFELRLVAQEIQGMLFGQRKKSLPFLYSEVLKGDAQRFFINPESILDVVLKYRSRDYSMFYREVLVKHQLGSDFAQKEVFPFFVLYPGYGTRTLMWQEMDGNKKDTPGRFFLPIFYSEKIEETLLQQLAYFRWELQKSIAGYSWTDPVEGGMVGSYFDYISFYKKNPDITSEAKVRLAEFIRKTKSDKDRFAKDYITWVESEYSGMVRLNNAARDIFYRFAPFPESIREELAKKPMYGNLEIKFKNRRKKELLKVQTKLIKFEKQSIPLPETLEKYLEFLKV